MPVISMTGFATRGATVNGQAWQWDLRAVNGRSLDLRLRLPEGIEGLEAMVRSAVEQVVRRGSVTLSLRRAGAEGPPPLPDADTLDRIFDRVATLELAAQRAGLTLAPLSVADLLDGRFVPRDAADESQSAKELVTALRPVLAELLVDFDTMRRSEGKVLAKRLAALIDEIAELVAKARRLDKARHLARSNSMQAALRRLLAQSADLDPSRLQQELALLAVKGDITEELDRLDAHVAAARAMLKADAPVGRKLDFLTQEFNREANTLCAKAQFTELTRAGLDLKSAIDQVREQVQNVE